MKFIWLMGKRAGREFFPKYL